MTRHLFLIAIFSIIILQTTSSQRGHTVDKIVMEEPPKRIWCLSDLGVHPSGVNSVGQSVQHLIDSAQTMKGKTFIVFDEVGIYCFHDLPKDKFGGNNIQMNGNVEILLEPQQKLPFLVNRYIWASIGCVEKYGSECGWSVGGCKGLTKKAF